MRQLMLGKTGLALSAVGIGGVQFSKIDTAQVTAIIDRARALGIDWIETAYGYFDSEEKIGAAVDGRWDGLRIISKNSRRDPEGFRACVEESLRRLRVSAFDLYQFHGVDREEEWEALRAPGGVLETARALMREGVIRHLGITTHHLELAKAMVEEEWVESVQLPISFIHREVADCGLLDRARALDVGMLAMKPFGGGRLGDARLCLGYLYALPGVLPVVGVEEVWQVESLAATADTPPRLTPEDHAEMERIRGELGVYFCRACRYCEPCPQGITIFQALYFPVYLKQMGEQRILGGGEPKYITAARTCTACGECETRCPFHLHIRDGLAASVALYDALTAAKR